MANPNPKNQFKPGKSANPGGRPKRDESVSYLVKKFLKSRIIDPKTGKKVSKKQVFVERVFALAMSGDVQAIKLIWNYVDGMPTQQLKVEQTNSSDEALHTLRQILAKENDTVKSDLQQRIGQEPIQDQ